MKPLMAFYLAFIFCILFLGVSNHAKRDKIIYEQTEQNYKLKTEIREMKKAEPWLLLLHENLPEIRQLELDCAAEALKQKAEREAKVK